MADLGNGLSNEALTIKLAHIEDAMREIQESMATRVQVEKLVGREEFNRLTWDLDQHKRDTSREISTLREDMEKRSWRALLKDWTTIVAAVGSSVALWAVFIDKAPK